MRVTPGTVAGAGQRDVLGRGHRDIAAAAAATPLSVADLSVIPAAQKRDGAAGRYGDSARTVLSKGVSAIADGGIAVIS